MVYCVQYVYNPSQVAEFSLTKPSNAEEIFLLGEQQQVIIACPFSTTLLFPVEIIQPLGTALLLRPRADVLSDLGPRQAACHTLT